MIAVTREGLASLLGVTPARVSQLVAAGMPARKAGRQGRRTEFDAVAALAWCRTNVGGAASSVESALREEQLRLQIRKLTADVRRQESQLVDVDEIEQRWSVMVAAARERLLSLPSVALQRGLVSPEHEDAMIALVDDALIELATRARASRD